MKLRLIRNATLLLDYAGQHILIDPYFAPKYSLPSFTGQSPNPLVELPLSPEQILDGVELVLVSHLHSDHFDPVAHVLVPKHLPLFCQPGDETVIADKGFQQVTPLADELTWHGIQLHRTNGHHGQGNVETQMGRVSGFVFQAVGEPIVYWAGDTILCDEVRAAINRFHPDVIVTHSCGAKWPDQTQQRQLIVMDDNQTLEVCRLTLHSTVIATHMEALDHATISRAALRESAQQAGILNLRIPSDGDILEL